MSRVVGRHATHEPLADCPNCSAPLRAADRFCPHCGQQVPRGRVTLHDIVDEVWHKLVGVDRSVLSLARGLLTRPGGVAADWVRGRRKRYFGPFGFVLWMVGLAAASIAVTHFTAFAPGESGTGEIAEFLQKHVNLVQLLQVPLLAGVSRLLFLRAQRNFAEQLVLTAYTTSLRVAVVGLLLVPAWYVLELPRASAAAITYTYVSAWIAYFAWATSQFHAGPRWLSVLKGAAAAVLVQLATVLAVERIGGVWFAMDPGA